RALGGGVAAGPLVADDPDRPAAEPGVGADQRLAVVGLVLLQGVCVDDARQQVAGVVVSVAVGGDEVVEVCGVAGRGGRVVALGWIGQQGDQGAQSLQA